MVSAEQFEDVVKGIKRGFRCMCEYAQCARPEGHTPGIYVKWTISPDCTVHPA